MYGYCDSRARDKHVSSPFKGSHIRCRRTFRRNRTYPRWNGHGATVPGFQRAFSCPPRGGNFSAWPATVSRRPRTLTPPRDRDQVAWIERGAIDSDVGLNSEEITVPSDVTIFLILITISDIIIIFVIKSFEKLIDYGSWYFFIKAASTISIRRGDANEGEDEGEGEVTRHYANDRRDPAGVLRRTANGK